MPQDHARNSSAREDWLRALKLTGPIDRQPQRIFPRVIDELAAVHGGRMALVATDQSFTFHQLSARAHRYAAWALEHGIAPGDRVGLLMANGAEYVAIWLGLTQIGGVVALLNTNLRGASLAHCIDAARPAHMIVDGGRAEALAAALPLATSRPRCWVHGETALDYEPIAPSLARADLASPRPSLPISLGDPALLIYTSGTTGWPKAAFVSHRRIMMWSHWFCGMMDLQPSDRLYNCLPLYHSIGGVVAVGAALAGGGSVLIRERFSASSFWDDIADNDCTVFQYIGELCRYLVNAETSAAETRHKLRLACGNGLSGSVWEPFERRFKIPRILEFYAATEGNFSLYNCEGKPGAIGRVPAFLTHRFNVKLVALDDATGAPARGLDGHCVPCAPGSIGEAIGEVHERAGSQAGRFEGYTSQSASQQKIIRDVFVAGDAWVRSGDLMRTDEQGFFYFVDRVGDTFRWKGENVATTEVAAAIARCPGVQEATVYGVPVPACEGRAGMAALVVAPAFNLADLKRHLDGLLPDYAQPVFVRLCASLDITTTFRPKKSDLARDGFDPAGIADPVSIRDSQRGYLPLDAVLHAAILQGRMRL